MTTRDDLAAFDDMLEFAKRAIEYAADATPEDLSADRMRSDALLRVLGVLGEAAGRVSPEIRARFTLLPWKEMRGLRNLLIHRYDRVVWTMIWETVTFHLPAMLPALVEAKSQMNAEQPPPPEVPE